MRIGIVIRKSVVKEKESYILYKRYIDYYKNDEIVLITPGQSQEILDMCDSFILVGGDDINPKIYNEENTNSNDTDDQIDEIDFKVIKYAYENKKMLLGICRGIQSINVFFGGTLHQHIECHMKINHRIKYINELTSYDVNSYHHQVINKLGVDLNIVAKSEDDVIEIIEHQNKKIFAVQFHPEMDLTNEYYKKILEKIYN
ncbi:MAG: type 1 glutamine amidotransferase [bacterium]